MLMCISLLLVMGFTCSNMGDWLVTNLLPRFDRLGVRPTDIMILNFAVWINAAEELAQNVMIWAEFYEKNKERLPYTIWRDASIQHFDTPTGANSLCMLGGFVPQRCLQIRCSAQRISLCAWHHTRQDQQETFTLLRYSRPGTIYKRTSDCCGLH